MARVQVNPDAKTILFSPCGTALVVVGSEMEIFRLSWSAEGSGTDEAPILYQSQDVAIGSGVPDWTLDLSRDGDSLNQGIVSGDGKSLLAEYDDHLSVYSTDTLVSRIPCVAESRNYHGSCIAPDGTAILGAMSGTHIFDDGSDETVGTHFRLLDPLGNERWRVRSEDYQPWEGDVSLRIRRASSEAIVSCFFLPDGAVFRTKAFHHSEERIDSQGHIQRQFTFAGNPVVHYWAIWDDGRVDSAGVARGRWEELYREQNGLRLHPDELDRGSHWDKYLWWGNDLFETSGALRCSEPGGQLLWQFDEDGGVYRSIVSSADGLLLGVVGKKQICVLNRNGGVIHRYMHDCETLLNVSGDGGILIMSQNGEVRHIVPDGETVNRVRLGVEPPRESPVWSCTGLCAFASQLRGGAVVVVLDERGNVLRKWRSPVPNIAVQWAAEANVCAVRDLDGFFAMFDLESV